MQPEQSERSSISANLDCDLQSAVAELLDLDQTDVSTNSHLTFIQLGGNSIKALELTFRLDAAGKDLTVESVLAEAHSIAYLSQQVDQALQSQTNSEQTEYTVDDSVSSVEEDGSFINEAVSRLKCHPQDIERILPLTSQQRGLWLGSLQSPGAYLSHWEFHLADDVAVDTLSHAWDEVLAAHPVLRTRILTLSDSQFHQIVLTASACRRKDDTLKQRPIAAIEGEPLFDVTIDKHVLKVTCHHALYDRWSMKLIFRDVQHAYRDGKLPRLPPSYLPFLRFHERHDDDAVRMSWKNLLSDEPVYPCPIIDTSSGFALTSEEVRMATPYTSDRNVTVAETIIAAWSFVCAQHAQQQRVSFGFTVSGRDLPLPNIGSMTFPTFNTIPCVMEITKEDTVSELLKRSRSSLALLRKSQHLDAEVFSKMFADKGSAYRFNSTLVIQQDTSTKEDHSSLFNDRNLKHFETQQSAPLVVECIPSDKEILFKMKHDPDHISTARVEAMMHHLNATFKHLSMGSSQPLRELNIFSDYDLSLVKNWVVPNLPLAKTTLHSLVTESAEPHLDAMAIWQTDRSWTYRSLLHQSRSVMQLVMAEKDISSRNIGICFEKSGYAIVAMLGVSMSGFTFVPLDASNPTNRLIQIVENAQVKLVLCSRTTAYKFKGENVRVIIVDDKALSERVNEPSEPLPSTDAENEVYIIYTSGSTGEPKGVVITQQALCTTLQAISAHLEFTADTRSLQFSSFAFDMSVHDIWCTLLKGGVVCIPSERERFELEEFLPRAKCNYAMLTPSVALTLSDRSWSFFKKLSTSGEPLPKAVIRKAVQMGVKFWNTYGPTESCVICITEQVKSIETRPTRLGYSMAATSWIIDANDAHRLAPVGCIGELALSGHTLSTGYYRDREKSENAFVKGLSWTKDFPDQPLERVYRTGDLAKYNFDGSIEFVGRLGGYIKIAGNRVDLGEIEEVLHAKCNLPNVSVQYVKIGGTQDVLVAFGVIPSDRMTEELQTLPMGSAFKRKVADAFEKLKSLLPVYMIPSAFVPVNRLPYNTAGKLDKKALLGYVADNDAGQFHDRYGIGNPDRDVVADHGKLSSNVDTLRGAWASVLDIKSDTISGQSNFFRLGGNSLQTMALAATVRQLGYYISVSDMFKYPSLTEMTNKMKTFEAQAVIEDVWDVEKTNEMVAAASKALHLPPERIESVMPCTSLQAQMLAASFRKPHLYLHRECFELTPEVKSSEVKEILEHLSQTNELLRSKAFVEEATGQFVLVILDAMSITFEEGLSQQQYLASDQKPMGIGHDLARLVLLEDGQNRSLVWEMHHSIYDGFSKVLLTQQLKDAIFQYRKFGIGKSERAHGFKDFVNYLNGSDGMKARNFWKTYLENASKLSLPFAKSVEDGGATNQRLTQSWNFAAPQSSTTTATYIKAAYALTLSQYTSSLDVTMSSTNHGRDLPVEGIDKLAGPTFSTLPLRCVIRELETLGAFLSRIQFEAAEIASYQYLSIDEISLINASCKQACQFTTHLLIQPGGNEAPIEELRRLGYNYVPTESSTMQLPISFNLVATVKDGKIVFDLIFNDSMFDSRQIELFLDQFLSNLDKVLKADPNIPMTKLCQMSRKNVDLCLRNQPTDDSPAGLTIPELLLQDWSTRQHNLAIYSTGLQMTYDEMFVLASGLAKEIMNKLPSGRHYIAVHSEKSPLAIIAQLGIMIAGHAYVSIDVTWPVHRKNQVLKQIGCQLLVASTSDIDGVTCPVIQIGHCSSKRTEMTTRAQPEDTAYVIFTSGSTGAPKGVIVQHDAICRVISTYTRRLKFTNETRSLLFASFSFDASVMETWSVLAAGGVLCIANDEERISDLDSFVQKAQVDCVALTPSSAMLLDPVRHDGIKTLLFCGEQCKASDIKRWDGKGILLVNAYGPSELSVNAVMNTNFSGSDLDNVGDSMGGGLWLVNPYNHDELVPIGAAGELLVTGPVLAKGYLNDSDQKSSKFVYPNWPNWTGAQGQRAYKTGDLMRVDTDGRLHFIGRYDGQMKVHGVRIEAEAIENVVLESDMGLASVVGKYSAAEDQEELALFFVPHGRSSDDRPEILPLEKQYTQVMTRLYECLSDILPQNHVPKLYVPVTAIPRSVTWKVDRRTLSQKLLTLTPAQINLYRHGSTSNNSMSSTTYRGSENFSEDEMTLISLWKQVLHIDAQDSSIGRQSHFIKLGGDSVTAIRLSSAARSKDIHLPVTTIYAHPVLSAMAAASSVDRSEPATLDLASPSPLAMISDNDLSPLISRDARPPPDYFGSF